MASDRPARPDTSIHSHSIEDEANSSPAKAAAAICRAFESLPGGLAGWFIQLDADADG